jgi:hypothetical protein
MARVSNKATFISILMWKRCEFKQYCWASMHGYSQILVLVLKTAAFRKLILFPSSGQQDINGNLLRYCGKECWLQLDCFIEHTFLSCSQDLCKPTIDGLQWHAIYWTNSNYWLLWLSMWTDSPSETLASFHRTHFLPSEPYCYPTTPDYLKTRNPSRITNFNST